MPAIRYCEEHRYAKNTETFIERPSTSSSKPAVRMEQHNGERRQASKTLSRKAARDVETAENSARTSTVAKVSR
jgi:hypothetical protein